MSGVGELLAFVLLAPLIIGALWLIVVYILSRGPKR